MATNMQTAESAEESPTETVLSAKITIRGAEIESDEDLTVYGRFVEGKVRVRRLTLKPGAVVSGQVVAQEIRSEGTVEGNITAEQIILYRGSLLVGEVKCEVLGVQPGSTIRARVDADVSQQIEEGAPRKAAAQPAGCDADFLERGGLRLIGGKVV